MKNKSLWKREVFCYDEDNRPVYEYVLAVNVIKLVIYPNGDGWTVKCNDHVHSTIPKTLREAKQTAINHLIFIYQQIQTTLKTIGRKL